ncbi:hypothetical protein Zmor_008452 [Zophobas morio]|uniref:Uncharacterized protein n=1 Tax=Zophobas morio TaxID=2755281 RepID=A0AA38IY61_9CUCU|nr:hypothetical protein Zmor_008452 [Zophobas morio]
MAFFAIFPSCERAKPCTSISTSLYSPSRDATDATDAPPGVGMGTRVDIAGMLGRGVTCALPLREPTRMEAHLPCKVYGRGWGRPGRHGGGRREVSVLSNEIIYEENNLAVF